MRLSNLELNTIHIGDCRQLAKDIPDSSVDLIFTDPPYPREYINLYEWLAQEAARVLKDGGLCITLAGHIYLDEIIQMMSKYLTWHWIGGMPHTLGSVGRVHPRQMMCGWKPMLWYSKGTANKHAYVFDMFRTKADKRHHEWGQPASWAYYYLDKLAKPGSLIFEPFAGGASTLVACHYLSLNFLAFEVDPIAARKGMQRLKNLQPQLFANTGNLTPHAADKGNGSAQIDLLSTDSEPAKSDGTSPAPCG